jgi:signal transduction histidine kinase
LKRGARGKIPQPISLLSGEQLLKVLSPHPLAFLGLYALCIYLTILGTSFIIIDFKGLARNLFTYLPLAPLALSSFSLLILCIWWLALLLAGFVASIYRVEKLPLASFSLVGILGTALLYFIYRMPSDYTFVAKFLGTYTILMSLLGYFLVRLYGRSFKYYITNFRIITQRRFLRHVERHLTYDKINDVVLDVPLLGRIFNFGTVVPITGSGFGLGSDAGFAGVSPQIGMSKRLGLLIFGGGGKSVKVPRARAEYELYKVPNPSEVSRLISEQIKDFKSAIHLKDIKKLLERMVERSKGES